MSGSLADRITKPAGDAPPSVTPAKDSSSWADEVASPTVPSNVPDNVAESQSDGAAEPLGGSSLHEAEYEVEVKLSNLQGDPNNPLYSLKSFDNIGM